MSSQFCTFPWVNTASIHCPSTALAQFDKSEFLSKTKFVCSFQSTTFEFERQIHEMEANGLCSFEISERCFLSDCYFVDLKREHRVHTYVNMAAICMFVMIFLILKKLLR